VTTDGVTDADSAACAVKRTMLERAERALLVADSSKFGTVQFERFATLADIDDLVTETPAPRKLDAALKGAGVTVRLALRG
jgi:DeoR/GlpR family transcriptional regulator of sugar metabolism